MQHRCFVIMRPPFIFTCLVRPTERGSSTVIGLNKPFSWCSEASGRIRLVPRVLKYIFILIFLGIHPTAYESFREVAGSTSENPFTVRETLGGSYRQLSIEAINPSIVQTHGQMGQNRALWHQLNLPDQGLAQGNA